MSRVVFDTFELHQHSMRTTHVTIEIFEVHNIIGVTMANQVKVLLDTFSLLNKVIAYIEDEGYYLSTLTFVSTFVILCFAFQLTKYAFWSKLGIKNLDHLTFIIKNWPNDVHVGCDGPLKPKAMAEFWKEILWWLENTTKWLRDNIFLKKIQALISFDFRFMSFLSSLCFFLDNFFLCKYFDCVVLLVFS